MDRVVKFYFNSRSVIGGDFVAQFEVREWFVRSQGFVFEESSVRHVEPAGCTRYVTRSDLLLWLRGLCDFVLFLVVSIVWSRFTSGVFDCVCLVVQLVVVQVVKFGFRSRSLICGEFVSHLGLAVLRRKSIGGRLLDLQGCRRSC